MAIVTMTQALKKLYKAVVGEDTTKNNPTKIVSDLADNYSGGGSGGGSGIFEVNITADPTDLTGATVDKTYAEIKEALTNGANVLTKLQLSHQGTIVASASSLDTLYSMQTETIRILMPDYQTTTTGDVTELDLTVITIASDNTVKIDSYAGAFTTV